MSTTTPAPFPKRVWPYPIGGMVVGMLLAGAGAWMAYVSHLACN
jgi:hypothetical protein